MLEALKKAAPLTIGFTLAALASGASATFVAASNSFIDTGTGLQWLQSASTAGMTLNEVLASDAVKVGGYRVATMHEVQTLFVNGGLSIYGGGTGQLTATNTLLKLLGGCTSAALGRQCGHDIEYWFLGAWEFSEVRNYTYQPFALFGVTANSVGYSYYEAYWPDVKYTADTSYRPDVATFLVRSAQTIEVPEPTTVALVGLGFAGIATARRRKVGASEASR